MKILKRFLSPLFKRLKFSRYQKINCKTNALLYTELFDILKHYDRVILYFDHNFGGGCDKYFWKQVQQLSKSEIILRIQYLYAEKCYKIATSSGGQVSIQEPVLTDIMDKIKGIYISEIIINNIVSYPSIKEVFNIVKTYKNLNDSLKVVFCGHDYYSICPNFTLLKNDEPCFGECDKYQFKTCFSNIEPLFLNEQITKDLSLTDWRNLWREFFIYYIDEFRCFSNYSKAVFENIYPEIKEKMTLVPHEFIPFKNTINVAVIGTLVKHKGAGVIENFIDYLDKNNIWNVKIYVVGGYCGKLQESPKFKVLGDYERENLPSILKEHNIDMIFIPSINGETFCYTAQEAVHSGYPALCFNIGGQAEQISQYDKGYLLESKEPGYIYDRICELYYKNNKV